MATPYSSTTSFHVALAAAFRLRTGEPVVFRAEVALLDDAPAELVWHYYPIEIARDTALTGCRRLPDGSPATLATLGHPVRSVTDQVSVRPATVAEFLALALPGDIPVLRQFRVARSDDDRPVEATIMIKAGQQFEIRYDVPPP